MEKFVPQSPDPFLNKDEDMSLAKFGHINAIVDALNAPTSFNSFVNQITTNVYSNNSQALAGGLTAGDFYRTSGGVIHIVV
jgi:hypothetical protein